MRVVRPHFPHKRAFGGLLAGKGVVVAFGSEKKGVLVCKERWEDPDLVGRAVLEKTCPRCRRKYGIKVTGHGYVGQVQRQRIGGAKTMM